ncbi:serine O-acetyltransferase [Crateriforma conspicua]|uniref:serine O-acetyltransferase n=1 Tax=Crateriforma conspicua TaxID=2527996 RepID=UPI001E46E3FD|nr:hypothetical protein [Crateriforma conspicua]
MSILARLFDILNLQLCFCEISSAAEIGPGLEIAHVGAITIGGGTRLGRRCVIFQGVLIGNSFNHLGIKKNADGRHQPVIGDQVVVGAGAKILGPVCIGSNVIVGANSVVVSDISPGSVAVGIPARTIPGDAERIPAIIID